VEKILVKTAKGVQVQCGFAYQAKSVLQAQMSLQYITAVALLEGGALLEQFSEAKIVDPRVLALARQVEVVMDPDIDKVYPKRYPNRVEIILKNGNRFETQIDYPKGSVEQPMSFDDVTDKFRSLAGYAVTAAQAECIIEQVERLEKLKDIRKLTRLLA
jgi:2-methylcitrate dehydratase PrpD